jgi:hypothetical protein
MSPSGDSLWKTDHTTHPPPIVKVKGTQDMSPIEIMIRQLLSLISPPRRDERGLSQSTENAILLAGAVTIAVIVITVITKYVEANLPK